jgi:hypothetical protein
LGVIAASVQAAEACRRLGLLQRWWLPALDPAHRGGGGIGCVLIRRP